MLPPEYVLMPEIHQEILFQPGFLMVHGYQANTHEPAPHLFQLQTDQNNNNNNRLSNDSFCLDVKEEIVIRNLIAVAFI